MPKVCLNDVKLLLLVELATPSGVLGRTCTCVLGRDSVVVKAKYTNQKMSVFE